MPERSDEELMLAAGRGDRAAFGVLVERHGRTVVHFVRRFLGDIGRETAEDLAQDVFLKAWKASGGFHPQAAVTTWLLQIATNTSLNYRRRQRLRRMISLWSDSDRDMAQRDSDPAVESEATERGDSVRRAIGALPTNQRAAIVLRHYHDFSYSQIAEVLELSVAAVESLLFRARKHLHRTLDRADQSAGQPPTSNRPTGEDRQSPRYSARGGPSTSYAPSQGGPQGGPAIDTQSADANLEQPPQVSSKLGAEPL